MSRNINRPDTAPLVQGVIRYLLVAATGLALSAGVAQAAGNSPFSYGCDRTDRQLTVFESGFTNVGQLCDEMDSQGFWGAWGGE